PLVLQTGHTRSESLLLLVSLFVHLRYQRVQRLIVDLYPRPCCPNPTSWLQTYLSSRIGLNDIFLKLNANAEYLCHGLSGCQDVNPSSRLSRVLNSRLLRTGSERCSL